MNKHATELLEKHFDTAFAAPDGIKKLRELILTLAMQGKLMPQDPNDQPASELLKEIEAERQRLVKEGKIKKPKPLPPVSTEEKPYALPQGWEWTRLGEIGIWKSGSTPGRSNSNYYGGNIPWVKSGEVKQGRIRHTEEKITQSALDKCSLHVNDKGSVLVAMYGANIGEVGILEIEAATNQAVCACKTYTSFDENYLLHLIISLKPYFLSQGSGAAQPNISREKIIGTAFPLPPLAEQHRIVAKIDTLMTCCDELEKLRNTQREASLTVHAAVIKQLLNIAEPYQHQRAQTFLAEHFDGLYTIKNNVAEFRKAILQLAVMGKLAPQDPNDHPASELLKEIESEKQRLVMRGQIKKNKPLPPLAEEEKPYPLPQGWEWGRLGDVALSSDSGWSPQCLPEMRKDQEWGVLKVSAVSWGKFNPNENKALPASQKPRPECEVKSGDFLISRANTDELVARSVVVEGTPPHLMMSDKIVRFSLSRSVNKAFVNIVNGVSYSRAYYMEHASGTSSSMKNVSRETMSFLPVPLPPFAEQHRIVAKVDELMTLCDTLEQQIDVATNKQTELLDALTSDLHEKTKHIVETTPQTTQIIDLTVYRTAVGCYAVGKLANAQYFDRTAAAKVMYLAQAHVGLELGLRPEREAAGPLDTWIYDFERKGQNKGWFEVNEKTLASGRKKTEYRCLSALSEPAAKAEALMSSGQKAEFDRLIYALADKKTEEVEIIATLFAVWNDFLIDGIQPTDEQIISDVRENWHERKTRFSSSELGRWLEWLRRESIIPRGLPPRTVQQSMLGLD